MKPLHFVLAIIGGAIVLTVAGFLIVDFANAQTPPPYPDIPLTPVSGTYGVTCAGPDDADMAELCLVRSDSNPVIELVCAAAGPSAEIRMEFELESTPNDDAEIRCYAKDTTGLVSDYSPNAGIVDFTPPGVPHVK
jgi:hypothetical protein